MLTDRSRWIVTVRINGDQAAAKATITAAKPATFPLVIPTGCVIVSGETWQKVYGEVCSMIRVYDPRPITGWGTLKSWMKRPLNREVDANARTRAKAI